MSEFIMCLSDTSAGLSQVGGKGASLTKLAQAGLPVPPGIHITTPAWTPLFAMASAVVTDIGGPLSHSSIVARELGIPTAVSCGNATMLFKTGDRVRLDGGKGIVEIL